MKLSSVPTKALLLVALVAVPGVRLTAQSLTVRRTDGREVPVTAAQLRALPDTAFAALDHGRPTRFRGVSLRAVLALAGAGSIDSLRGSALRRVLVLRGADGYGVVIALADLDASLGGKQVFVATEENGVPLEATRGPFRAVVLGDARAARWVRQLTRLEVIELP